MKRHDLLVSPGYIQTRIQIDLYNQIQGYMEENGLNRTQLADRLGYSKGYISQILNGDFDHKLSKLIELSLKIGKVPFIEWKSVSRVVHEDENSTRRTVSTYIKPVSFGRENFNEGSFEQGTFTTLNNSIKATIRVMVPSKDLVYAN